MKKVKNGNKKELLKIIYQDEDPEILLKEEKEYEIFYNNLSITPINEVKNLKSPSFQRIKIRRTVSAGIPSGNNILPGELVWQENAGLNKLYIGNIAGTSAIEIAGDGKISTVPSAINNNIPTFNTSGSITDSGYSVEASLSNNSNKIPTSNAVFNAVSSKLTNALSQGNLFIGNASGVATSISLNASQILIGNNLNQATPTTLTGDASLSNSGVITINSGTITSNKIANSTITSTNIANSTITDDKLVNMPANTIKGNNSNSSSIAGNLTPSQVSAMLGATSLPTANSIAMWDTNSNFLANNLNEKITTTQTNGGTLNLTPSSTGIQRLIGTQNHTIILPDATSLNIGTTFTFLNESTANITINAYASNAFVSMISPVVNAQVTLTDNSTPHGIWNGNSYSSSSNGAGALITGEANQVAYFTGSNTVTSDPQFTFNGVNVGIGGNFNPNFSLSVNGSSYIAGNLVVGSGENGTPQTSTIRGTNATGSNIPGALMQIQGSIGTGYANGGDISFQTSQAPTIVLPTINSTTYNSSNANTNTLSYSHTIPAGQSNSLLLVEIGLSTGSNTATSVKYGTTSLTKLSRAANASGAIEIWYLLSPTASTANIIINLTNSSGIIAYSLNITNVLQSNPFTTPLIIENANGTSANLQPASSLGSLVLDFIGVGSSNAPTQNAGQTLSWKGAISGDYFASSYEPGSATQVSTGYTFSSSNYSYISFAINGLPNTNPNTINEVARITSSGYFSVNKYFKTNPITITSSAVITSFVTFCSASTVITATLPPATSVLPGTMFVIVNTSTSNVTVSSATFINGTSSVTITSRGSGRYISNGSIWGGW